MQNNEIQPIKRALKEQMNCDPNLPHYGTCSSLNVMIML
jgi:hypothetical protein